MREAGTCILYVRNLVFIWLFLGALLQAAPVESYAFLTRLNRLEQNLISFSRYYLLREAFPHQRIYTLRLHNSYETYERGMRQSANTFTDEHTRQILTHLMDAKNIMENALSDKRVSKNISNLMVMGRKLEKEIQEVSEVKMLALEPKQQILYALTQMQVLLEKIAQNYVFDCYHAKGKRDHKKEIQVYSASFERLMRLGDGYTYWSTKEHTRGKRILTTWKVLKKNLNFPNRPLLIGLGVAHMQSLLAAVQVQYEEQQ